MDVVIAIGLAAAMSVGGVIGLFALRASSTRRRELAQDLGFELVGKWWFHEQHLVGSHDGVPVAIEYFTRSAGETSEAWTRIVGSGVHPDITISGENIGSRLARAINGQDFLTGDPRFDDAATLHGPEEVLLALLDASTRLELLGALTSGHRVTNGSVVIEVRGSLRSRGEAMPYVEQAVNLANRLRRSNAVPDALRRNAIHDPEPGVRRKALKALADLDETVAWRAHLEARSDHDPTVRIAAALHLREFAAIEEMPTDHVVEFAAHEPEAIGNVLRRFESEASLVPLLECDALRAMVCERLAVVGTGASVPALRTHTGLFASGDAKKAIDAIHARLGHQTGMLAVAQAEAGELAEAGEAGRLSENED